MVGVGTGKIKMPTTNPDPTKVDRKARGLGTVPPTPTPGVPDTALTRLVAVVITTIVGELRVGFVLLHSPALGRTRSVPGRLKRKKTNENSTSSTKL